jgi:ParB family chromosome partitioning protein
MNDKRKALGRGLASLLPATRAVTAAPAPASEGGVREIPIEAIDRNPYQTRGKVDEEALNELAASIRVSGVVQPIVVRPFGEGRYQIIAGERRWLASQRAGKSTIPAVVRQASDEQAMEITIIENLQREDLNPIEQARAYERLSRDFGLTQEQMAQRTGKDRTSVANFLRLLKLPVEAIVAIEDGRMSFGHGKVLLMLANEPEETARKVIEKILVANLSVRQTEELVHNLLTPRERAPKEDKQKDPNVRAAEASLQRTLGCKVDIEDHGGKGKIVLKYASLEDFDRILSVLNAEA